MPVHKNTTAATSLTKRAQIEARRDHVMRYAVAGYRTREIADILRAQHGIDVGYVTVANDIKARLKEAKERDRDGDKLLNMHRRRLEQLRRTWWPRALKEPRALDRMIILMREEAKFLNYEPPKRIALGGDSRGDPVRVAPAPRTLDLTRLSLPQLLQFREIRDALAVDEDDPKLIEGEATEVETDDEAPANMNGDAGSHGDSDAE